MKEIRLQDGHAQLAQRSSVLDAQELLVEIRRLGLSLTIDGNQILHLSGPKEAVTQQLLSRLRDNREALIKLLRAPRSFHSATRRILTVQGRVIWVGMPGAEFEMIQQLREKHPDAMLACEHCTNGYWVRYLTIAPVSECDKPLLP